MARLEQFDYDAAEQSFRQALAIDPRLAMARLNLAIALLHAGKLDEAEADARAASSALPDSPNAQYVLGLVLRNQNRLDEAIAAFTRVSQIDAADAGTAVNLGQILQEQRKYPEAVAQFRRAIDAEAYNVTAAYGLATALARAGQADESATALARFETLRNSAYGTTFSQTISRAGPVCRGGRLDRARARARRRVDSGSGFHRRDSRGTGERRRIRCATA